MLKTFARLTGMVAIVSVLAVGCSNTMSHHAMSHQMTSTSPAAALRNATATAMATPAAELKGQG